ncbi:Putative protein in type-1 retrotransposable element R1DM [Araneus ventricosus]|uniref:Reverse transcriptase domain-containing protein n=1 Tax=Araneus ventricosus TaxID=182803 RepID=A0A4Y2KLT0_ARAVE|nr:Putative protein in type-1 retrotransposable element R1DM [Araneus ventricosus]
MTLVTLVYRERAPVTFYLPDLYMSYSSIKLFGGGTWCWPGVGPLGGFCIASTARPSIKSSRQCFRGCPQGSVIAPVLWDFYINSVLNLNNGEMYIQAFADDLALIIGGRTARELESNTNIALAKVPSSLDSLKLKLSIQKYQAVVYRSISSRKFSKRNSTVLNRKPTFKINNISIKVTDSLKLLGFIIDNKLTRTAHINSLHDRTLFLTSNFNRVIKSDWSVNKNLMKAWYLTTIEKALLYGASVWGGALTKVQIDRLHSIQRIFLLKFTRGYRTMSTNVLNVLSGIPPLHITAEVENIKISDLGAAL